MSASSELFEPDRLLAFSAGVFGVAITLLVVDMHLPANAMDGGDAALLQALAPGRGGRKGFRRHQT
jgi:uncharacterized membrane protein